jgi:NAD(P)H-binding
MNRTALIVGATGGIGSETARALIARGWTVRALSRNPKQAAERSAGLGAVEWVQGDAMNASEVVAAAAGVSVVVHAVNPPGYRNWKCREQPARITFGSHPRRGGLAHLRIHESASSTKHVGIARSARRSVARSPARQFDDERIRVRLEFACSSACGGRCAKRSRLVEPHSSSIHELCCGWPATRTEVHSLPLRAVNRLIYSFRRAGTGLARRPACALISFR